LFHAAATESELGVVLKMATRLPGSKNKSNGTNTTDKADGDNGDNQAPVHTLVILSKDLIQVDAANVDFTIPAVSTVPLPIKSKSPATEGKREHN
jgi:hypothetical protein